MANSHLKWLGLPFSVSAHGSCALYLMASLAATAALLRFRELNFDECTACYCLWRSESGCKKFVRGSKCYENLSLLSTWETSGNLPLNLVLTLDCLNDGLQPIVFLPISGEHLTTNWEASLNPTLPSSYLGALYSISNASSISEPISLFSK